MRDAEQPEQNLPLQRITDVKGCLGECQRNCIVERIARNNRATERQSKQYTARIVPIRITGIRRHGFVLLN